jgi:hypothetical protein
MYLPLLNLLDNCIHCCQDSWVYLEKSKTISIEVREFDA